MIDNIEEEKNRKELLLLLIMMMIFINVDAGVDARQYYGKTKKKNQKALRVC